MVGLKPAAGTAFAEQIQPEGVKMRIRTVSRARPRCGAHTAFALLVIGCVALGSGVIGCGTTQLGAPVSTYAVKAANDSDLARAVETAGPKSASGRRYPSVTRWEIQWSNSFRLDAQGMCQVDEFVPSLEVSVLMPEWTGRESASAGLRKRWDRFIKALEFHEQGHVRHAQQAVSNLVERVGRLGGAQNCDAAEQDFNRVVEEVLSAARSADIRYDEKTDHGRTQGAIFR